MARLRVSDGLRKLFLSVKAGGPDANANVQLAAVLQAARQSNVPKDIIDRNIKKASDKDQAEYIQQTYEVGLLRVWFEQECS